MTESHKDFTIEISDVVCDTDFIIYYKDIAIILICECDVYFGYDYYGYNLVIPCDEIKVIGVDEY